MLLLFCHNENLCEHLIMTALVFQVDQFLYLNEGTFPIIVIEIAHLSFVDRNFTRFAYVYKHLQVLT